MKEKIANDILKAGTGFMQNLTEAIRKLEEAHYKENLVACYDHFECQVGKVKIFPEDFVIDKVMRFENTSDPDDQSVLYAITAPQKDIKGIYIESYGTYHESFSEPMLKHLKESILEKRL